MIMAFVNYVNNVDVKDTMKAYFCYRYTLL